MKKEQKASVMGRSIPITWLSVTALAKNCLFPERSFF